MLIIAAIASFVTMFVFCILIWEFLTAQRRIVDTRLEQFVADFRQAEGFSVAKQQQSAEWRAVLRQLSRYFESRQLAAYMEQRLIQAGWALRGAEFLVICSGTALLFLFMFFLITAQGLLTLLGGMVGFGLPFFVLKVKIARRAHAFNEQLGDSLILIANSLRTGYSFMQSLEMVAKEMPEPIAVEFSRSLREMNLGITTEEALNNLAKRVNSDDLDLVITAVLIQRQVGGNLAEILDNIAGTIRERVKIKGQIRTLTAQGRISGIIIGVMPIGLGMMIYMINPDYINVLFREPLGKMMLAGAIVSEILGILCIRKIVNIEI